MKIQRFRIRIISVLLFTSLIAAFLLDIGSAWFPSDHPILSVIDSLVSPSEESFSEKDGPTDPALSPGSILSPDATPSAEPEYDVFGL